MEMRKKFGYLGPSKCAGARVPSVACAELLWFILKEQFCLEYSARCDNSTKKRWKLCQIQ